MEGRYVITPFQGFDLSTALINEGLYPSLIYNALSGLKATHKQVLKGRHTAMQGAALRSNKEVKELV